MNTAQMQTKETYKANGANYILTTYSKISSYVIDTIINWCVHNEEIITIFCTCSLITCVVDTSYMET